MKLLSFFRLVPHVVLLKLMTSVNNGKPFRQACSAMPKLKDVPVVLGGCNENLDFKDTTDRLSQFLPKPFNLKSVIAAAEAKLFHPIILILMSDRYFADDVFHSGCVPCGFFSPFNFCKRVCFSREHNAIADNGNRNSFFF